MNPRGLLFTMTDQNASSKFRNKAKEILQKRVPQSEQKLKALSSEEMQQTLHELQVHQIELEIQNEELRRAHGDLDALRARYFDLYNLAPVSHFTVSKQGLIVEANLTAAILLGVDRRMLIHLPFTRFIHEEDQDAYYQYRRQLLETSETLGLELRMVKYDGTFFWGHLTACIADGDGDAPVCHITLSDITERKELSKKLRSSEQATNEAKKLLELVLDTIPVRLFWKDLNSVFLGCNRLFAQDAGLRNPIEIVGTDDYRLGWKDQADLYRQGDLEVITSRQPKLRYEEVQTTPDGQEIWLSTSKVPLLDINGEVIGVLGVYEDITQRKRQEAQLESLKDDLELKVEQRTLELQETQKQYLHAEKLSAIGKLSASIAHEFNNPLQSIQSILKGLRKRAILEEEDSKLLDAAIGESERVKNLIRSLQDFNRPSSGRKVLVNLHNSLDSLLLLHKSEFKNKRISVTLDYAKNLPQILAVPDQIKQVFLNLLTNAADACLQPGGVITVSTWQEDDKVAVAIKDTGIGIKPENMELIFQPFYTTKPAVKGTRLGLSVSHGIVKNHGGEILVTSRPGEGAKFTVLLPINSGFELVDANPGSTPGS